MEIRGAHALTPSCTGTEGVRGHRSSRQEGEPHGQLNGLATPSRTSDGSLKGNAGIAEMMLPAHEMAP